MTPKKPAASAGKKQKTVASSSQPTFDPSRFRGPEQFERYQVLERKKIWNERKFDIFEHGSYERFVKIINDRRWGKIVEPPKKFNPTLVREFYANAYPSKDEPFSFTTMMRGKTIRFDRDAINTFLGNPFTLPANETLCAFQKQRARKNWDIDIMRRKLLRPNHDFAYGTTNKPLRALREDMRTFTQLLFLLVLYNILPNSHTFDAVMNILGLIHYLNEGLEVDLAGIISNWMKEITMCGHPDKKLKLAVVRSSSPMGFPCLIMGLCTANRIHIPEIGSEEIGVIDDDYVDRYCKPKKKRTAQPPPPPPPAQASASAVHDQNFYNHFTYLYDQNDAGYRAMSAMHQSFYNQHRGQSVMTPQEFQTYVAWPEVRPTFLGGGDVADAEAANEKEGDNEGDNASEGEAGSDASMQEGDGSDAGSESGSASGSEAGSASE
ncbi:hypothetical protein TSUD_282530 [Trifolium subterraneum]|uniref:Putative plant transposon protein domain-containing protein n=1 Tax=Trifolium subterraneum TaxID=3900 RepID=A0A2Z6PV54_TRISU|nr:hypothetical protein TSUD_282530 [Trifolium subterraneum]